MKKEWLSQIKKMHRSINLINRLFDFKFNVIKTKLKKKSKFGRVLNPEKNNPCF